MARNYFSVDYYAKVFFIYILMLYRKIYGIDTIFGMKIDRNTSRVQNVKRRKSSKHKHSFNFDMVNVNKSYQQHIKRLSFSGTKVRMKGSRIFYRKGFISISKNKLHSVLGMENMPIQNLPHSIMLYPLDGDGTLPKSLDQFFNAGQPSSGSMHIEMLRLESFNKFPSFRRICAIQLARTGFFYIGHDEIVQCFSCGVRWNNWSENEHPVVFHRRISPQCKHVLNQDPNNVPIHENSSSDSGPEDANSNETSTSNQRRTSEPNNTFSNVNTRSTSQNRQGVSTPRFSQIEITNTYTSDMVFSSDSRVEGYENCTLTQRNYLNTRQIAEQIGQPLQNEETQFGTSRHESVTHDSNQVGFTIANTRYPQYENLCVRLSSFIGWPSHLTQTPGQLAHAGFFYAGYRDCVRCFFCGGGLIDWEDEDDPWTEHARWYPMCTYLRHNKGVEFVNLVLGNHQSQHDNETRNNLYNVTMDKDKENIMNSIAVQSVLEMGYSTERVLRALKKLGSLNCATGEDFEFSAVDIYDILAEEETILDNDEESSASHEMQAMDEENQRLKNEMLCKVCLDKKVNCVFLPCGHLCCVPCASELSKCHICRAIIKGTVKMWLS